MKYNPKVNEDIASLKEFTETHPYSDESSVQGNLGLMYQVQEQLKEITGMDSITLQPAAVAIDITNNSKTSLRNGYFFNNITILTITDLVTSFG